MAGRLTPQQALNRSNARFTKPARTRAGGPPQLAGQSNQPTTHISPKGKHTVVKPSKPPTKTPPAKKPPVVNKPTPTPAAPPVQPFLTPGQQQALNAWNTRYQGDIANLTQTDQAALAKYNTGVAGDAQRNTQETDFANQSMAARGLFTSSIRDGALNDLASTLQQQENLLQTNYNATQLADQTQRQSLAGQDAATQSYYDAVAVQNAQNTPPTVPPPVPPGGGNASGGNPNQPHNTPGNVPGAAPPAGVKPPVSTGGSNQPSTHHGATSVGPRANTPRTTAGGTGFTPGPNLGMKGAAKLRMGGGGLGRAGSGVLRGGG